MPKIKNTVEANELNLTTDSPFSELNTAKAELEELAKQFLEAFNWLNATLNNDKYPLNKRQSAISATLNNLAKEVNNIVDNKILKAIKTASIKSSEKFKELKQFEEPELEPLFAQNNNSTKSETPVQSELDKLETEFSDFI